MHPEVRHRKIQRHRDYKREDYLYGLAWIENGVIDIEDRIKGYKQFYALVHEYMHFMFPDWSETRIKKHSRSLAWFLWRQMKYKPVIKKK